MCIYIFQKLITELLFAENNNLNTRKMESEEKCYICVFEKVYKNKELNNIEK